MLDWYDDDEENGFELGQVRYDERSLGREIPPDLQHYVELQRRLHLHKSAASDQLPLLPPEVPNQTEDEERSSATPDDGEGDTQRRILLPPGSHLNSALRFLLTPAWYRTRIYPTIADMHEEYFRDLEAGRSGHARYVVGRTYFITLTALLSGLVDLVYRLLRPKSDD